MANYDMTAVILPELWAPCFLQKRGKDEIVEKKKKSGKILVIWTNMHTHIYVNTSPSVWGFSRIHMFLSMETKENCLINSFYLFWLILHASYAQFSLLDWTYSKDYDRKNHTHIFKSCKLCCWVDLLFISLRWWHKIYSQNPKLERIFLCIF